MTGRAAMDLVLRWAYERDAENVRFMQAGEVARALDLELKTVTRALDRLLERGYITFISQVPGEHRTFQVTEMGRVAAEDQLGAPALHWKQDVHGHAANQVGHHNTINYYGLNAAPASAGAGALVATPVMRFSVQQVNRQHHGLFLANLNPYAVLLEDLRFEREEFVLRAFEWDESPRVTERLRDTERTYLATVQHPMVRILGRPVLPPGEWTFAARFMTTGRPERFEARVRCVARPSDDLELPTEVSVLSQTVVAI